MKAIVFVMPESLAEVIVVCASLVMLYAAIDFILLNKRKKKAVIGFEKATANFRRMFQDENESEVEKRHSPPTLKVE